MNYDKELKEWADKVDPTLPMECPECKNALTHIKYALDMDRTTIHLTGAVNKYYYFLAECPHCKHVLEKEGAGERHIR